MPDSELTWQICNHTSLKAAPRKLDRAPSGQIGGAGASAVQVAFGLGVSSCPGPGGRATGSGRCFKLLSSAKYVVTCLVTVDSALADDQHT
jgi:hypothetical protein